MADFAQLLQTFGLAVSILITLAIALWRILLWARPWVEKVMQAHIDFVNQTSSTVKSLGDSQQIQAKSISDLADSFKKQSEAQLCKYQG